MLKNVEAWLPSPLGVWRSYWRAIVSVWGCKCRTTFYSRNTPSEIFFFKSINSLKSSKKNFLGIGF
jgi:hypothetical protein